MPFCEGHELPVRRQFNAITAFVDASNVYASDDDNSHIIRTHLEGEMKVTISFTFKQFCSLLNIFVYF